MDMDFDATIAWLDARIGERVFAATQTRAQEAGNTKLSVIGALARQEDGEITLIDPRPGRIEVFRVGEAVLVLLEGDFVSAGAIDFGAGHAQVVQAEFLGELTVVVGETPEEPTASL